MTDEQLDEFAAWERLTWETRATSYARSITQLTRGAAAALLDAAEVGAGTALLDVATGPGVVGLSARRRGAEVVAVDQSESMVTLACAAGLDARRASADRLPFETGAFDAVVAGFLINHLPRPGEGVAELARVSKAFVALSVWDTPDANPALGLFGDVVQSVEIDHAVPPGPDSTLYADDARLTSLLVAGGLDDIRISRVHWSLTVAPGPWFDAVATGTPRTGAVLAAASPEQRAKLRRRYIEAATASYGAARGLVVLPAAAVVASGRSTATGIRLAPSAADDLAGTHLHGRIRRELRAAASVEVGRGPTVVTEQAADAVGDAIALPSGIDHQRPPAGPARTSAALNPAPPPTTMQSQVVLISSS